MASDDAVKRLIEAAKAWRAQLGDSPDQWLTGPARDLAATVDELERPWQS